MCNKGSDKMNYSDFELTQLMCYQQYKDICYKFFALAKDEETKQKLESILYKGGYKDYNPSGGIEKNNPLIDIQRRIGLAYLIIRNPETFEQLVNNKIVYFHGTDANALPGIIKYGINSVDKSMELGINVTTGENWSRIGGRRDFVSFTDVLDLAREYSMFGSKIKTELSFPIIFGTTKENILKSSLRIIRSDVQEVGVNGNFPKELITCIMVPSSKIDIVRKMVGEEVLVLSMDEMQERFYSIYQDGMLSIFMDEEKYEKLLNNNFDNAIELKGVKGSVFGRVIKKVKNQIVKLRNVIMGDIIDESRIIKR